MHLVALLQAATNAAAAEPQSFIWVWGTAAAVLAVFAICLSPQIRLGKPQGDIGADAGAPKLVLDEDSPESLVRAVHAFVSHRADEAVQWYRTKRWAKRRPGLVLRVAAMIFTAAAGLLPLIKASTRDGVPAPPDVMPTVLIAFAGLFLLLDRFGDFTGGWVRYMKTGLEVDQLAAGYRVEFADRWQRAKRPLSDADAAALLGLSKRFLRNVDQAITRETDQWVAAFQQALGEIDRRLKDEEKKANSGAVEIAIDPQHATGSFAEWTLRLGEGHGEPIRGLRAARTGLTPGFVTVRGEITVGGTTTEASQDGGAGAEVETTASGAASATGANGRTAHGNGNGTKPAVLVDEAVVEIEGGRVARIVLTPR